MSISVSTVEVYSGVAEVTVSYLAMVLSLILQHLLQVEAASQVTFSQMVAELWQTEQTLLRTHCFTVAKKENAQMLIKKQRSCD